MLVFPCIAVVDMFILFFPQFFPKKCLFFPKTAKMPLFELSCIYRNFSGATAKKAFNFKRFRRIQSRPKQPSKIAKLPLTHKTRNQFGSNPTRVRIPPAAPHQFPRGNPLGSWFFIGLHSRPPLIRSPLHPPRTAWSCSPDGHIHWLWLRNHYDRATPGSAS